MMKWILTVCAVLVTLPTAALMALWAWQMFVVLAISGLLP